MPRSIVAPPSIIIRPEPLTQDAYAPFGTVVQAPSGLSDSTSAGTQHSLPPNAVVANQGSAVKLLDVTSLASGYAHAPGRQPARPVVNMFCCAPRRLRRAAGESAAAYFDVRILERHPYTPQTFVPLGVAAHEAAARAYLVIVAPTLAPDWSPTARGPPDLARLRAYVARGDQAVTYAAGTWHAPMVVLGERGMDFVVLQHANGVENDDCQEAEIEAAAGERFPPSVELEPPHGIPGTVKSKL